MMLERSLVKLRVALVNPVTRTNTAIIRTGRCQARSLPGLGVWPPIGLAQIAASIREISKDIDIWLYDAAISNDYNLMVEKTINYNPDIIIINCTTPTIYDDLDLAKEVKVRLPDTFIIFYGTHAVSRPEDIVGSDENTVDCVIISEPEITSKKICQTYLNSGKAGLKEIPGIVLSMGDKIYHTEAGKSISHLDSLGFPARDLINNKFYKLPYNGKPFTIIQPSRGCIRQCIFCTSPMLYDRILFRSLSSLIDEIKEVVNKYNIHDIMFLSDTFTASKKWVHELCNEIINQKIHIRWMANSRADTIDEETAQIMKKAGCWLISLGIESASESILKTSNKRIKIEDIWKAVKVFNSVGIKVIGYFMFGLPGETKDTINETIDLSCKLPIDYAYYYVATPFPGTKFFDHAVKNGWLKSMDWRRFFHGESDVIEYDNLSSEDLLQAVNKAYKRFYLHPKRVLKYIKDISTPSMLPRYFKAFKGLMLKFFSFEKPFSNSG